MTYLYHLVPKNLRGDVLYPLNELKEKYPDIYKQQIKKYSGREYIAKQKIPVLDCLWNDVLHFSSVGPGQIKQALIEAGQDPDFKLSCYQINPGLIEPKKAIVYLFTNPDDKAEPANEEIIPYDSAKVAEFSSLPQATIDYYKETIGKGIRPLLFYRIPHILYKGHLGITDLPVISA